MGRSGAVCENPTWHPKSWWILVALHIFTLQLPVKKKEVLNQIMGFFG
jgi:hypothetical protein